MDTIPESDFDEITMLASQICDTPIALVSLVDDRRQWFKSHHGLAVRETPKDIAFCSHAIHTPDKPFVVFDSRLDVRFHDNPLVVGEPHVIFYAGMPLVTPEGNALGTLCVIDKEPKDISDRQLAALKALSHQVMCQLELRRKNAQLKLTYDELNSNFYDIEQFASVAAHDLRSPLHNITTLVDHIFDEYSSDFSDDLSMFLGHIKTSSLQLSRLVDAILEYSRSTQVITNRKEAFELKDVVNSVIQLLKPPANVTIKSPEYPVPLLSSRIAIKQILLNLVNNAIKYNNKPGAVIEIGFDEDADNYYFRVADNGPGIPERDLQHIFNLFQTVKSNRESGTGIGLSIVRRLIKKLQGDISVESTVGQGTTFSFYVRKSRI